ncbi:MAG: UDP-glucose/GDP-mannose dehydrogenase family protein [Saprospiraceae bacterium]|nr:UDP-glucose/GDP-mannose dehydrogenase family protein [Saprospiraceae bacterium]MCF8250648.1 UDP-glucose/GDP-mannose dehydrogenase family protein [Saprospiraceae bacterium]MCF8280786.1 UDP-glucose/GDP-mannose dehydrogenase family protein [Bacteroidales bacterium]MCF8312500.1 UDP-glucose/GDP-mannose dehydrogenase family protein [Saprospiraceae bacterium]MCF8440820.1 UDP-glucose/GDP-mannose dehydrogenase family protein [Saprospiraceae bacterium]
MNIAVVGTGYVGLVTGTCFAETGNTVICVDIDENKVKQMQNGKIPIYEPGLDIIFDRNTKQGRLTFTTDLAAGIKDAEVIFLALPTPPGEDGSADLKYILGVAKDLSKIITDYKVIIDKSTVPVGTAEKVHALLAEGLSTDLFDVVSNPEFLREGVAVEDFMKPDRVVIGTESDKARKVMKQLYEPFVRQGNPIYFMDERSAEMTKYAANSYLATRISFMNEIANLCEKLGANVDAVRVGMGSDSRIGKRFLFPGVGYGGSCFPKDVQALAKTAEENGYNFKILEAVMGVNTLQKHRLTEKIKAYFNNDLKGKTIALWGLAFKPNTDDIREAPALYLINDLLAAGATVKAFDPEAMNNVKAEYNGQVTMAADQYEALIGADALAIVTEWSVFRTPSYEVMKQLLKKPVIFDGRNLYDVEAMQDKGFYYDSIGRNTVK